MRSPARTFGARVVALVRADPSGIGAGFVALLLASVTGLVAGLTLGSVTGTLEELPGLLVLVPPAIAMRGSIMGALGSRLGTAIHTGVFQVRLTGDSLLGQNVTAALSLSFAMSGVLALYAKLVAAVLGVPDAISLADFMVVSVIGAIIASVVVLAIAVGVAALSANRGWDLDNVAAPIVTSAGDVVALPALLLATLLTEIDILTPILGVATAALAVVSGVVGWRSRRDATRSIVRESLPILLAAGAVSTVAGAAVEQRAEAFLVLPVFLVLLPPFLGMSGSLGGILAARLSTKLHLGLFVPGRTGMRAVSDDVVLVVLYAIPVFVFLGVAGNALASLFDIGSPGLGDILAVTMFAGALITVAVIAVATASAVGAHRYGVDPDNFGIPMVTSVLDLGGAFALVLAIVVFGFT